MRIVVSAFLLWCGWMTQAAAFPVTVDNCGTAITFATAPQRLIVHDINMSEMAFSLGLQDRMVGVTGITGWYKLNEDFKTRLGTIPELAPKYPSMENLTAAAPDLFFAGWYYGMKPGGEVTPETLRPFGIETLILSESCIHRHADRPVATMDLLFDDVRRLGTVFGRTAQADLLVRKWKRQLDTIRARIATRSGTRVFLYDSGDEKPFTAGKFAIVNAMIEAAGGVNVTRNLDISWGRTSWESIAAADPEFLILLDYQSGGGAHDLLEFLQSHPVMRHTQAVKQRRFVALRYEELTPGPANIAAIEKIARSLYPGAF